MRARMLVVRRFAGKSGLVRSGSGRCGNMVALTLRLTKPREKPVICLCMCKRHASLYQRSHFQNVAGQIIKICRPWAAAAQAVS